MTKIKLSYLVAFLVAIFCVVANNSNTHSSSGGPPANRCGLYGTQPTCTACHSFTGTNNATATIALAGAPTNYATGQTYT
ncbi:MAG: hypothetical protein KA168_06920, partial [Chitinophagales bacterium]|nr:hypothetical protein [Chitinophagales bacterium]